MREFFTYKGVLVKLVKVEDGWRYYASDDESVKIRIKGFVIEKV